MRFQAWILFWQERRCKEEWNEFGMEFTIEEGNDIPFRRMIVEEELHWLEEEEKAELN